MTIFNFTPGGPDHDTRHHEGSTYDPNVHKDACSCTPRDEVPCEVCIDQMKRQHGDTIPFA